MSLILGAVLSGECVAAGALLPDGGSVEQAPRAVKVARTRVIPACTRFVDAAAAQLLVTEAGGAVAFPAADDLSLEMRSPVLAARDQELLEHLRTTFS